VEPFAFALHAVRAAAHAPGEGVLVLGGGPIGLAVAAWARHLGAGEVAVADHLPHRRALATTFGASLALDAADAAAMGDLAERLGGPPEVVFECVGRPGLLEQCLQHVRRRGRVIVAGACMAPDTLVPAIACLKEVDLRFVVSYSQQDFALALRTLAAGRIASSAMITDHVSLDALPKSFAELRTPGTQCKVMLDTQGA
ncbi:MAG: zinc-binding dehydrogenase, partial [Thermodesulfobacteriota bacterium]